MTEQVKYTIYCTCTIRFDGGIMLFQDLISQMYFNSFGPEAKSLCNGFLSFVINDNIFLFTFFPETILFLNKSRKLQ